MTIGFNTPPGVALGDAVNAIREVEREMGLPPTIVSGFSGSAQVFQQALAGQECAGSGGRADHVCGAGRAL